MSSNVSLGDSRTGTRILVLTSLAGFTGVMYADALAAWVSRLFGDRAQVRIEKLEDTSFAHRYALVKHKWIARSAPWLFKVDYAFRELRALSTKREPTFGRTYFTKVINEFRPNVVVAVHEGVVRGYFSIARAIMGCDGVKCVSYCDTLSGGWGYSSAWINPDIDLFISHTQTANDYAVKKGIPRDRTYIGGPLFPPHEALSDIGSPALYRTRVCGLLPDRFTIYLPMFHNIELLDAFHLFSSHIQLIIRCRPNDSSRYGSIADWSIEHPELRICLVDPQVSPAQLNQASDVVVCRASTVACARALFYGRPLAINVMGGIMPQEQMTWKYVRRAAAAERFENSEELNLVLERWMTTRDSFSQMEKNASLHRRQFVIPNMIAKIVDLAIKDT